MLVLLGAYELSFIRAKKTIRYFVSFYVLKKRYGHKPCFVNTSFVCLNIFIQCSLPYC